METLTIEIKKSYARQILEDLQILDAIAFTKTKKTANRKWSFDAVSISTKDFKFNREEANER